MKRVIWFTGLSGSGKTTLALELKKRLEIEGYKTIVLDGDIIRNSIHKKLGFSREEIRENNFLVAKLAKEKSEDYDLVLVPIISPYKEDREMVRTVVGSSFTELFVNSPLSVCIRRDVKGLYRKALSGEISNFIGIAESNPYEPPEIPDIEVKTDSEDVHQSVSKIISLLREKQ